MWDAATARLTPPFAIADLDAFDANAADMERRAGGLPIRVASKSVRCRDLLRRVLDRPGFSGVMAFSAPEALWLAADGFEDIFVAYPSVDRDALSAIGADPALAETISLTIDSAEHVDLLASLHTAHPLRVVLDIDTALRIGPIHLGVRRSPVREADEALALARYAIARGLRVAGLMFYDAQIAGVPDERRAIRLMQGRSEAELRTRRAAITAAVRGVVDLDFVNAGGTGSLHRFAGDAAVTELAAGSGLYGPALFSHYSSFTPLPAVAFALPVVRRPAPGYVTLYGGGYIASGPPGETRVPQVIHPWGLKMVRTEGAGEVQTPVHGAAADGLRLGDRVWLRHAKAGELAERFTELHLIQGGEIVGTAATYRGDGRCFG
ncbi:MAG: amino acid deaminase/aldolase [Micrococcales bacterium]|nr:amino acid deaminase/aldolase [Micrococcales bacterium]